MITARPTPHSQDQETDMIPGVPNTEDAKNPKPAAGLDGLDEQSINQLVNRAKAGCGSPRAQ
jgi:hypothetical protein